LYPSRGLIKVNLRTLQDACGLSMGMLPSSYVVSLIYVFFFLADRNPKFVTSRYHTGRKNGQKSNAKSLCPSFHPLPPWRKRCLIHSLFSRWNYCLNYVFRLETKGGSAGPFMGTPKNMRWITQVEEKQNMHDC
jgi:hypothetical protein